MDDFRIFYGHGQGCPIDKLIFPSGKLISLTAERSAAEMVRQSAFHVYGERHDW